jgi:hypothetical protein
MRTFSPLSFPISSNFYKAPFRDRNEALKNELKQEHFNSCSQNAKQYLARLKTKQNCESDLNRLIIVSRLLLGAAAACGFYLNKTYWW